MAFLPLVIAPDPRLNQESQLVEKVDDELRDFLDIMLNTMYKEDGGGLAAVQVGVHKKIFIVDDESHGAKNPIFFINPEIIAASDEIIVCDEGCLSFPDQRVEVARPAIVRVRYLDYDNNWQELEAGDYQGRAIQHELDHTNGITFVHRIGKMKRDIMLRKAGKIKKYNLK